LNENPLENQPRLDKGAMATNGSGAGTVMLVLGGLAVTVGLVLFILGPGLIEGGTEESLSGDEEVSHTGRTIQAVGGVVGGVGVVLILVGTGVLVAGRRGATT
jgi:hypothetical protein